MSMLQHSTRAWGSPSRYIQGLEALLVVGEEEHVNEEEHPGVVSSSWRWYVERCLRELDMYEDAAVIVTGSDGLPLKPAPAPYQAAARVFRPAPPGAVLAVEDSGSGVRSAVAAGLACAAVYNPDSGAQDLSPARWRLNSLYELPALLDGN